MLDDAKQALFNISLENCNFAETYLFEKSVILWWM